MGLRLIAFVQKELHCGQMKLFDSKWKHASIEVPWSCARVLALCRWMGFLMTGLRVGLDVYQVFCRNSHPADYWTAFLLNRKVWNKFMPTWAVAGVEAMVSLVKLFATRSHRPGFLHNHVEFCNEVDILMLRLTALLYFTLVLWYERCLCGKVWVLLLVRNSTYDWIDMHC